MQHVLQSGSFTIRNFELISPIGWKRPEQDWYDGQAHQRGTHMIEKWEMSQPVSILQGRTGQSWVYLAADEVTNPRTFSQDLKLCMVFVKASVCPFLYHFVGYGGMRVSRELSRREATCGGLTHVGTHHVLPHWLHSQPGEWSWCQSTDIDSRPSKWQGFLVTVW